MKIRLNVYKADNKNEVEKTYETDTLDLSFGTIEDVLDVIDIDKVNDKVELGKMIFSAFKQLKPFLQDVFEGLTDDEVKRTKVKELIPLFVDIVNFALSEIKGATAASKN